MEKRILTRDTDRRKASGVLKNVQWSDFPMDLLMLVAERLTPADHVRMSTTCKSWQCAAPSFLFSKTPILLFIENNKSYFFDPLSKMKWATCIPELLDATFHYSKGGWLLLSQKNNQSQFFFLNPFTNEKINLPNFYPNTSYKPPFNSFCKPGAFVVTFSSPPTSQDCVIFVISAMTFHNPQTHTTSYFYVYYECSHKDMAWEWKLRYETDGSDRFNDLLQTQPACYKNPLSFNGFFYYLNTRGALAIIKLTKKTTMTQTVKKPRQMFPECEHYDCYLVESQGEILAIFCNGNKKIKIFQVDHSVVHNDCGKDKWIELKSLRDNLFFLDRLSSLSTVVKGGDMIYFPKSQRGCNDFEEPARRIWVDPNFILKTL